MRRTVIILTTAAIAALSMLLGFLVAVAVGPSGEPAQPDPTPTVVPTTTRPTTPTTPATTRPPTTTTQPPTSDPDDGGQGGGALAGIDFSKAGPTPAHKRVIEVVDRIKPKAWRVSAAVNWLDRYTASDMRMVSRCSGKAYRCVTVKSGRVGAWKSGPVGWSQGSTITIDTGKAMNSRYKRWYRYDSRRTWLLAHELGHQFGLGHVGKSSRTLMNPYVNRGKMVLTKGQRAHLRKR